eukprot:353932-Chlamydomonas_euryale.AAC.4
MKMDDLSFCVRRSTLAHWLSMLTDQLRIMLLQRRHHSLSLVSKGDDAITVVISASKSHSEQIPTPPLAAFSARTQLAAADPFGTPDRDIHRNNNSLGMQLATMHAARIRMK